MYNFMKMLLRRLRIIAKPPRKIIKGYRNCTWCTITKCNLYVKRRIYCQPYRRAFLLYISLYCVSYDALNSKYAHKHNWMLSFIA